MFDLGWQEFMLIAFVAVVVVGPRDLPRVIRSVSTYIRKARSIAREFQNTLEEVAREAELDDLRKEARNISNGSLDKKLNEWVDPSGETQKEMERIANQAKDAASSRPAEESAVKEATPVTAEAEPAQESVSPPESSGDPEPAQKPKKTPSRSKSAKKSSAAGQ